MSKQAGEKLKRNYPKAERQPPRRGEVSKAVRLPCDARRNQKQDTDATQFGRRTFGPIAQHCRNNSANTKQGGECNREDAHRAYSANRESFAIISGQSTSVPSRPLGPCCSVEPMGMRMAFEVSRDFPISGQEERWSCIESPFYRLLVVRRYSNNLTCAGIIASKIPEKPRASIPHPRTLM